MTFVQQGLKSKLLICIIFKSCSCIVNWNFNIEVMFKWLMFTVGPNAKKKKDALSIMNRKFDKIKLCINISMIFSLFLKNMKIK